MRCRFIILTLGMVACLVSPAGEDVKKQELAKLSGEWEVVQLIDEGDPAPAEHLRKMRVMIEGEKITIENGSPAKVRGRFALNPSAKPPAIDLHWDEPKVTCWGIYEVRDDRLKICCTVFEDYIKPSERPTEFVSGEDGKGLTILISLKRAKK